jgi:hypothetical protein
MIRACMKSGSATVEVGGTVLGIVVRIDGHTAHLAAFEVPELNSILSPLELVVLASNC